MGAAIALTFANVAAAACGGDCDGSREVTVDEVVTLVNVALGSDRVGNCTAGDVDNNSQITVDEIVVAVNNALFGCPADTTATPSATAVRGTPTRTPTPTRTGTPTRSPTRSPTARPTPTITRTPTVTPTPSPVSFGPYITFFGLASAGNYVVPTSGDGDDVPVFTRPVGAGFFIVVEAKRGLSGFEPGTILTRSDPANPATRPDLQILSNRPLGDGSPEICDNGPEPDVRLGGIPGFDPPEFAPDSQAVADALNDLGCRLDNFTQDPCTLDPSENPGFVRRDSTVQVCTQSVVHTRMHFPPGDTLLVAQWADTQGNLGLPARMIVRVPVAPASL